LMVACVGFFLRSKIIDECLEYSMLLFSAGFESSLPVLGTR